MPGPEEFEKGLEALGLRAERRGQLVVVTVDVHLGPLADSTIDVGTDPPGDFPRVPPHWIHLPEKIELPGGGRNASELGAGWSKWSRQHPRWRAELAAASQWLAHVRSLLMAATVA